MSCTAAKKPKKITLCGRVFLKKILSVAMGDLELIKSSHRPPQAGENFGVFETVLQSKLTSRVHSGMCFGRKRHQKSSKISACGELNLVGKSEKSRYLAFPIQVAHRGQASRAGMRNTKRNVSALTKYPPKSQRGFHKRPSLQFTDPH